MEDIGLPSAGGHWATYCQASKGAANNWVSRYLKVPEETTPRGGGGGGGGTGDKYCIKDFKDLLLMASVHF